MRSLLGTRTSSSLATVGALMTGSLLDDESDELERRLRFRLW